MSRDREEKQTVSVVEWCLTSPIEDITTPFDFAPFLRKDAKWPCPFCETLYILTCLRRHTHVLGYHHLP